ncbi:MAG: M14 family metallopeptidase [Bacteroidales bacterium]
MNKYGLLIFITFLIILPIQIQAEKDWQTYYEESGKKRTPSYAETVRFARELADASAILHYKSIGKSHQERDIPLLILDGNGNFSPEKVKASGKTVLLVQAAIHPGEPAGKDAGFILLRDIAIYEKYTEYLENITLLFIPILNVDGHERFGPYNRINQDGPEEMGWRTNALNLNLNRDYLKADSKEIEAFLTLWHEWEPDFFIDTHSTNGGDYQYAMTYSLDIFGGTDPGLVNWMEEIYLPQAEEKMEADGYPIFPYVSYRSWHDPLSGLRSGVFSPMFSTGYVTELNRPGLLLETHMLKPYPKRVESTQLMILHTMNILNQDNQLKNIIQDADRFTASPEFRKQNFPLRFELTGDSVIVDFLGVAYTKKQSSLSGGNWFVYDSDKPVTYQIPWFNKNQASYEVRLPEAYIIPVQYQTVIERLALHGVEMKELTEETEIQIEAYRFNDVQLAARSTEGRQTASFKTTSRPEIRIFPKGSVIIPIDQSRARIIAHALEPLAPGSFAYWGFFNSVFERAEYFESYVMEKMAREMLAQDPSLRIGLEKAMEENPTMARNPYAILSWFYEQTPYYDQKHNVYPVGRIVNPDLLKDL